MRGLPSGKFRREMNRQITAANKRIGTKLKNKVKAAIDNNEFPPNSPATRILKGSGTALEDQGKLKKAIRARTGLFFIQVGVFPGFPRFKIVKFLSEDRTITVTPKMARFFSLLNAASRGKAVRVDSVRGQEILRNAKGIVPALKVGTTLTYPARPLWLPLSKDPEVARIVRREYRIAYKRTVLKFK